MEYNKNIKIDEETWKLLFIQRIDRNMKRVADVVRHNALSNNSLSVKLVTMDYSHLREKLSNLEHEQWIGWSKYLARQLMELSTMISRNQNKESLKFIEAILVNWNKNWKPYSDLDEPTKDKDRIYADKILEVIKKEMKN